MITTTPEQLRTYAGPDERAIPCPVCGGRQLSILLEPQEIGDERRWLKQFYAERVRAAPDELKDRAEFTQAEPTYIVRCDACGTVLRDPQPTPEALRQRYAADSYGRRTLQRLAA